MSFYDLHVHSAFSEGTSSIEQLASTAKVLGFNGICFAEYFNGEEQIKKLQTELQKVKEKVGIEVFLGFEARNSKELNVLANKRKKFDVLLVHGGNLSLNREAVETPEVDILTHPEAGRYDSGLNHVMMKLAAKNDVAIEINFRQVLINSKKSRNKILQFMRTNVMLAKKYHTPIIICSGAVTHFELRDPYSLIAMGCQLGLSWKEAKESVSKIPQNIIMQNKERRDENWILSGVKIIKNINK